MTSPLFASLWSTISRPGQIDLAEPDEAAPEPVTAVQLEAAMRLAYFAGRASATDEFAKKILSWTEWDVNPHSRLAKEMRATVNQIRALAGKAGE